MGIFRKKENQNEVRVMYYEGLRGFGQDLGCIIAIEDDAICFKSIKPEITVSLQRSQIQSVNIMPEINFMARYHGNAGTTSKFGSKMYCVIHYQSSGGADSHIAVWYAASELKTGDKLRSLKGNQQGAITSYAL